MRGICFGSSAGRIGRELLSIFLYLSLYIYIYIIALRGIFFLASFPFCGQFEVDGAYGSSKEARYRNMATNKNGSHDQLPQLFTFRNIQPGLRFIACRPRVRGVHVRSEYILLFYLCLSVQFICVYLTLEKHPRAHKAS